MLGFRRIVRDKTIMGRGWVIGAGLSLWVLANCAGGVGETQPPATATSSAIQEAVEPHNPVAFPDWLDGLRAEAASRGFQPATLAALDGLQPIPRVIELDRKQ